MSLILNCSNPTCGQTFEIDEAIAGAAVICPKCGETVPGCADTTLHLPADTKPLTPEAGTIGTPVRIGRFDIRMRLGEGAFGIVYHAYDTRLEREVALKVAKSEFLKTPKQIEQFSQEAKAAANLRHQNIVPVYDSGEDGRRFFIATAFIRGNTLQEQLDDLDGRPLDVQRAVQIIRNLAEALAYAHEHGIVHCDVKPSNIMIDEHGHPLLADFGLARRQRSGDTEGSAAGTPAYMAPEQWDGGAEAASDQYSLGVTLFQMLTGTLPFTGTSDILCFLHHEHAVPSLRYLNPLVSRDLEAICLKCLKKKADDRYVNGTELADDLRRFQEGWPVRTRPTSWGEQLWKWGRRRPAVASLIAASFIALVSLVLYLDQWARSTQRELEQEQLSRERREKEEQRVSARRENVQSLYFQARGSVERGSLQDAQTFLGRAFENLGDDSALGSLEPSLVALRDEVAGRVAATDDERRFFKLHDSALFHGLVFSGVELPANLQATKEACSEALRIYGVTNGTVVKPVFPKYFSEKQQEKVRSTCYELLLVWAEAEAQPAPGQTATPEQLQEAVRLLDRAALLNARLTNAYHLRRANYLALLKQDDAAEKQRLFAAKAPPAEALDYFLLGDTHQKLGRLAEASRDFATALRIQPDHFWGRYFLAVCNLQLQQPAQARDNLTACLASPSRSDFLWLYVLRGFANGQLGDFPAAEKDYEKALSLAKSDEQAKYGILVNRSFLCLLQAKKFENAIVSSHYPLEWAYWGVVQGYREERLVTANRLLDQAVELQPDQYPAYRYLAVVAQQRNQPKEAVNFISKSIEAAKNSKPAVRAQLISQRARLQRDRNARGDALADLNSALDIFPNAEDYLERGWLFFHLHEYEAALASYKEALQIHHNAIVADQPAIKLRRSETEVYRLQIDALVALKQDGEAAEVLDRYLAKKGPLTAKFLRLCATIHERLKKYPEALADYAQALAVNADSATHTRRAWVFLHMDAAGAALKDFEEALRLDPNNLDAIAGKALARVSLGQPVQAIKDADAALSHARARVFAQLYSTVIADSDASKFRASLTRVRYPDRVQELLRRKLEQSSRHELLNEFADRALESLRAEIEGIKAPERLAFWREHIAGDRWLGSLRRHAGFERLERQYGKEENRAVGQLEPK